MASFSSDIARLIHHHLVKEGYEKSANNLIIECPDLKGFQPVQPPYKLPRLLGPSLLDLLESYLETKDFVIEELDLLKSAVFRAHDSLPSLTKTLIENIKSDAPTVPQIPKETCDASINTEVQESDALQQNLATEKIHPPKETCDASVNTEVQESDVPQHLATENIQPPKETGDACVNTDGHEGYNVGHHEKQLLKHTCDASVNTDCDLSQVLACSEKCDSPNSSDPPMSEREETIDFALVYDRLLEDRDFQEKIAENINKKKALVSLPNQDPSNSGNFATAKDLNEVIKAIVAETQADPAFDNFLQDCLGFDSEDPTPVSTPDSTAQIEGEPTGSPVVTNVEENQENGLVPYNAEMPLNVESLPLSTTYCTFQGSEIISHTSSINSLNSVAIVTSSGHIALVPTTVSALPLENNMETVSVPTKKTRKKRQPILRKAPVTIAPKPVFTITVLEPEDSACNQVPATAVTEAVSEYVEEFRVSETVEDVGVQNPQAEPAEAQIISHPSSPRPSQPKPAMRTKRPLSKKTRKNLRNVGRIVENSTNSSKAVPPEITPALATLLKIAQEACKTMNIPDHEPPAEAPGSSEVVFNTPTPDSSSFVTTPTSTRRRSHVRQLNFGESPELPVSANTSVEKSPTVLRKRTDIPWDLALRNAIAVPAAAAPPPPSDEPIFATPKGKAKRARKHSPPPPTEVTATSEVSSNNPGDIADSFTPTSSTTSEQVASISSTPVEKITSNVEPHAPHLCATTDNTYADLVTASILKEIANTPFKEINTNELSKEPADVRIVELSIPESTESQEPNFCSFGMSILNREELGPRHVPIPVLATPRKDTDVIATSSLTNLAAQCDADGQSSTSFGAWDGEIPRTPQIRLDLTSSTSPFQVSLTKGFRFLPAADSPSLAVPATPCIFEATNTNSSIETPYTGFYQFPSVLNTPRLEALRQEILESPNKGMTITMISPTQVVLGRPTPYFVPSGERSQGPIINQNATPEHFPELERRIRRRSSTEMDPLQLEESNDASDAAAALMSQAAASVAAALQPPTPYKTDQTLENDLISECMRLDAPSVEKSIQRRQRFIDLFGEDSNNPNESTTASLVPEKSSEATFPITPKTAKGKTRKPRRTALNTSNPANSPMNSGCARSQGYSAKSKDQETENIVQEVLAMAGVSTDDSAKQRKRKRRSESNNKGKKSPACETESDKQIGPKRLAFHDSNDNISEDQSTTAKSTATSGLPETSVLPSPPRDDVDVVEIPEPVVNSAKKSRRSSNRLKEAVAEIPKPTSKSQRNEKKGSRIETEKHISPKKTPVKLFKSSMPTYSRKAVSFRQSAGAMRSPYKGTPKVPGQKKTLESKSIEHKDGVDAQQTENVDKEAVHDAQQGSSDTTAQVNIANPTPMETEKNAPQPEQTTITEKEAEPVTLLNNAEEQRNLVTQNESGKEEESVEPVPMTSVNDTIDFQKTVAAIDGLISLANAAQATMEESLVTAESVSEDAVSNNNSTSEADFTLQLEEFPTPPLNSVPVSILPMQADSPARMQSYISITPTEASPADKRTNTASSMPSASSVPSAESTVTTSVVVPQRTPKEKTPQAHQVLSKEISRRSNSNNSNYLKLSRLSTVPPNITPYSARNPSRSATQSSSTPQPKMPVNSGRQLVRSQETLVMHKDFVNKIRKELRLSKEFDIFSQ